MNMTMTYDGTMVMPKNYAVVTEDEMTYVEGGGTLTITITKNTICSAIGILGGVATKAGLTAIFASASVAVATAIELGTAGTGTLIAGLLLYYGSTAAAAIAGAVVKKVASGVYTGGDLSWSVTQWGVPTWNVKI